MEAVLWFDKRMTPLEAALEAFGRTRSSQITPLILELGRAEPFTPPQARKNFDFHRAWLAAVGAPAARTWAMSTLSAQLPKLADGKEAHFGDQSDALEERLRALLVLAPDPRISSAVLALAELNPPVVGFVDVMIAMAESLAHHADDATRDAIPPDFFATDDNDVDLNKLAFPISGGSSLRGRGHQRRGLSSRSFGGGRR